MKKIAQEAAAGSSKKQVIVLVITTTILFLLFFPIYPSSSFLLISNKQTSTTTTTTTTATSTSPSAKHVVVAPPCDLFTGEWVQNPKAPYYTNTTCRAIHEHQNCQKYGRPDSDYLKWKWKPDACDLPIFDPVQFLELVRDKSLAFIGDSMSRNQMQSLICLLSTVEHPVDASYAKHGQIFVRWNFSTYNFTVASFWTPHLVKSTLPRPNAPLFGLYLDEPDETWTKHVDPFDYLIVSGGHWFYAPSMYYENKDVVGCNYCQLPNVTDLTLYYGYRKAFRTAFKAINSLENYKGITFLRTFSAPHFENGLWNQGGNCVRIKPFKSNETVLEGINLEIYKTQIEEFKSAERQGRERGLKFRLLDTTQAMLLRPDGHPSRYGHWPSGNGTTYSDDCVHWCLPGPIDTWSDFLLQMLRMERGT